MDKIEQCLMDIKVGLMECKTLLTKEIEGRQKCRDDCEKHKNATAEVIAKLERGRLDNERKIDRAYWTWTTVCFLGGVVFAVVQAVR